MQFQVWSLLIIVCPSDCVRSQARYQHLLTSACCSCLSHRFRSSLQASSSHIRRLPHSWQYFPGLLIGYFVLGPQSSSSNFWDLGSENNISNDSGLVWLINYVGVQDAPEHFAGSLNCLASCNFKIHSINFPLPWMKSIAHVCTSCLKRFLPLPRKVICCFSEWHQVWNLSSTSMCIDIQEDLGNDLQRCPSSQECQKNLSLPPDTLRGRSLPRRTSLPAEGISSSSGWLASMFFCASETSGIYVHGWWRALYGFHHLQAKFYPNRLKTYFGAHSNFYSSLAEHVPWMAWHVSKSLGNFNLFHDYWLPTFDDEITLSLSLL